jgi:hypothetical protein
VRGSLLCVMLVLASGCNDTPAGPSGQSAVFDFHAGPQGFSAGFADYPPADEAIYFLTADYRALPASLGESRSALFISGVNRSDDLFMFYTGRVANLEPNRRYQASFAVQFATRARTGCAGVGGAEDSVWIKAGVSMDEPTAVLVRGYLRMTIDKGNQSTGGTQAQVLGTNAGTVGCDREPVWELRTLVGGAVAVQADSSGRVWALIGSDSGFESLTELYYTRLTINFEPA